MLFLLSRTDTRIFKLVGTYNKSALIISCKATVHNSILL